MNIFKYNNCISKNKCHFIAANGFPPASYNHIFNKISAFSVQSPLMRPLWDPEPPPILKSWMQFADDLVPYVKEFQPKIVLGHSIGAIIWLLYSIKYNYSFEKVIMIDPALFPKWVYRAYRIIHAVGLQKQFHPLVKLTLNRKKEFNSLEEILVNFKEKDIFSKINDNVLKDYISSVFQKNNHKYSLMYSPEWESIIYEKGMLDDAVIWDHIKSMSVVTEIIYLKGEFSSICKDSVSKRLANLCSHFYSYEIPNTTHLLPFEQPSSVADIINIHLKN
ncbi:hypothetical protein DID74_01435 [Candidatus Marinamargulisbacteria bacterium SCGC AG-333-B06]|nr:hypothetical protein DID74_01435 [Candidatus Marinamargulisbacteria bacterium SCGC AG-333-B06]